MKSYRYVIELGAFLLAYIATLVLSLSLIDETNSWRVIVSLLPMVPAIGICWSIIRQLQYIDELQRKIQFEAIALAFAGTALVTFSYGFLENVGFPKLSMFMVWPLMGGLWAIGVVAGSVRYR